MSETPSTMPGLGVARRPLVLAVFGFVAASILSLAGLAGGAYVGARAVDAVSLKIAEAIEPLAGKQTFPQSVGGAYWPLDLSEVDTKSDQDEALSTTPIEALDQDLDSDEQTEGHAQSFLIHNADADDYICLGDTTWADSCGAGDMTCRSGATTDGKIVPPESTRTLRLEGNQRPCIQGSAAISEYNVERSVAFGPRN